VDHRSCLYGLGHIFEFADQDVVRFSWSGDPVIRLDYASENPTLEELTGRHANLGAVRLPNPPGLRFIGLAQYKIPGSNPYQAA
jgi:hypothetical protein